jgi:hypothetical protein
MIQASTVVKLPTSKSQARNTNTTKRAAKALSRQTMTATAVGLVATSLTALSLSHLAHGVEIVTHSAPWQAWSMAVGIDLGFIATELACVTVADKLRKMIDRFARPAILGTLAASAAMNAFAFAQDATGIPMAAAAIAMGISIPSLIYALTRIGAAIYIDSHNRG